MHVRELRIRRVRRVRPPGPNAETRRLCVTSESGLFWSLNWDSCEEPKNSDRGRHRFALIISWRHDGFASAMVRRSFTARSTRTKAMRKAFLGISPTLRTAAIAQVVDVVHMAVAVAGFDQGLHDLDDVFFAQNTRARDFLAATRRLKLHPATGDKSCARR